MANPTGLNYLLKLLYCLVCAPVILISLIGLLGAIAGALLLYFNVRKLKVKEKRTKPIILVIFGALLLIVGLIIMIGSIWVAYDAGMFTIFLM